MRTNTRICPYLLCDERIHERKRNRPHSIEPFMPVLALTPKRRSRDNSFNSYNSYKGAAQPAPKKSTLQRIESLPEHSVAERL